MPENDDVIHMILKAGIPMRSISSCEVLMVEGVLLVSRTLEAQISRVRSRLEDIGIKIAMFDLPPGGGCLDPDSRAMVMDAVVEALAGGCESLTCMPFAVTPRYVLVNCEAELLGKVLEHVPCHVAAAGFGDLPLIVVDFGGDGVILHNSTMSSSVQAESSLTEESMSELSRLLSSTCSVDEFLKALG